MNDRFPKRFKLRKSFEFQKLKRQGRRLVGQTLCIDWCASDFPETRLGITASRHFGAAHERNRFKRLVREAFRKSTWPSGLDLNVSPRHRAKLASFAEIRTEMLALLKNYVTEPRTSQSSPNR